VEQIRQHIGADSLGYLSIDGMMEVVREGIVDQDKGTPLLAAFAVGFRPLLTTHARTHAACRRTLQRML
jgi:glutamine phosphoribosylpyrophosphate amidotransferase